jgi:hypothetical protein
MSVILNAVDLVFMIDGKTAPDTDEQDEHYEEKPEGAAPATGRLSPVSPNALQAISGSEERTEDEPPDHACITTATIASIVGRTRLLSVDIPDTSHGELQSQPFSVRRRNFIPSRPQLRRCNSWQGRPNLCAATRVWACPHPGYRSKPRTNHVARSHGHAAGHRGKCQIVGFDDARR